MADYNRKNLSTALSLIALVAGMVMLAYASVPLYRLFCQATGFGGTPLRASSSVIPAGPASAHFFTVRYNTDVDPGLPWAFRPTEKPARLKPGVMHLTQFEARNLAATPTGGTAIYNVTPLTAAPYFVKIQCFCFQEQHLAPRASALLPVSFYIDPKILTDPDLKGVDTITLSYTFFPLKPK